MRGGDGPIPSSLGATRALRSLRCQDRASLPPSRVASLPARTQRFLQGPFAPGADLCSRTLAVSPDGKLLFSGGHWDNSLRVTSLGKGKVVGHITRHIGTVSPSTGCQGDPGWRRGHLCSPRGSSRLHQGQDGASSSSAPQSIPLGATCWGWAAKTHGDGASSSSPRLSGCHRCCHLPGARPVWHLPHFWLPGHHLHGVAGPAAGTGLRRVPALGVKVLTAGALWWHNEVPEVPVSPPPGWVFQRLGPQARPGPVRP